MLTQEKINNIKKELSDANERLSIIFDVLGDSNRFRIFKLLIKHREFCVTDIARILNITVPAASQQLRLLERLDLVKRTKMGQEVCYEINKSNFIVEQLAKFLKSVEKISK